MTYRLKHVVSVIALITAMGFTGNTQAEDQACVLLEVGSGYAAKIRLTMDDKAGEWHGPLTAGFQECLALDGFVDVGQEYKVELKAELGESKHCEPQRVREAGTGASEWHAHGTVQRVRCELVSE